MNVNTNHTITIQPVLGGFIVTWPATDSTGHVEYVQEVATSQGKAMKIVKTAVEHFSLVKKTADDAEA